MEVKSAAEAGEQNATATAAHPTNSLFIVQTSASQVDRPPSTPSRLSHYALNKPKRQGFQDIAAQITPQSMKGPFTIHSLLQVFTVNWSDLQGILIDAVQATHIDGDRF